MFRGVFVPYFIHYSRAYRFKRQKHHLFILGEKDVTH